MKTLIVIYILVALTLLSVGMYIEIIIQQNTQPEPTRAGYVTTYHLAGGELQPTIAGDKLQKGENPQ